MDALELEDEDEDVGEVEEGLDALAVLEAEVGVVVLTLAGAAGEQSS